MQMHRLAPFAALLALAACGEEISLDSFEQGVAFAKQRGLVIESSTDLPTGGASLLKGQACAITGKKGKLSIYQFVSKEVAATYINTNKQSNPNVVFLHYGKVVFAVEGKTFGERQEILVLLK
jgi:hypothetical protein